MFFYLNAKKRGIILFAVITTTKLKLKALFYKKTLNIVFYRQFILYLQFFLLLCNRIINNERTRLIVILNEKVH